MQSVATLPPVQRRHPFILPLPPTPGGGGSGRHPLNPPLCQSYACILSDVFRTVSFCIHEFQFVLCSISPDYCSALWNVLRSCVTDMQCAESV